MEFKKGEIITFDSGWAEQILEVKQGGMGVVYICEKNAYKTINEELFSRDSEILKHFEKECRIWINLGLHPFIVEAKSIELISGHPFVRMDKYQKNLGDVIFEEKLPLNIPASIRIAMEICLAMIFANQKVKKFVHRDLKPSNILMGQLHWEYRFLDLWEAKELLPKYHALVTDFGLSGISSNLKADISSAINEPNGHTTFGFTKMGPICGTPPFMSPEQCLGAQLDQRSDIYSFGCIFYEILSGMLPFQANTAEEFISHHISSPPMPLRNFNSKISDDLNKLVMKCLQKRPDKRADSFLQIFNELHPMVNLHPNAQKHYVGYSKSFDLNQAENYDDYISQEIDRHLWMAYKLFQLDKDKEGEDKLLAAKQLCPERMGIFHYRLAQFIMLSGYVVVSGNVPGLDRRQIDKIKSLFKIADPLDLVRKAIDVTPDYLPKDSPYKCLLNASSISQSEKSAIRSRWLQVDPGNPAAKRELIVNSLEQKHLYRKIMEVCWDNADSEALWCYFDRYLIYESDRVPVGNRLDWINETGETWKKKFDSYLGEIKKRPAKWGLKNLNYFYENSVTAFRLQEKSLVEDSLKILIVLIETGIKYLNIENISKRNKNFKNHLTMFLYALMRKVNKLDPKIIKDSDVKLVARRTAEIRLGHSDNSL